MNKRYEQMHLLKRPVRLFVRGTCGSIGKAFSYRLGLICVLRHGVTEEIVLKLTNKGRGYHKDANVSVYRG